MPAVEVVDMRHELKVGNRSIFSSSLMEAMDQTLDGWAPGVVVSQSARERHGRDLSGLWLCGAVPGVRHSVHLPCFGFAAHLPSLRQAHGESRSCARVVDGPRIRYLGVGTQRVEEEVRHLFPRARVLRWDRDVTGGKGAHEEIVRKFSRHEADVLVGTQMIAKGLDFPLVTLVGVISADTGLHMPDFRAPERSFQLLTQVAGRAGRASLPSRVVVQTYTPDHYAVEAAREHDYLASIGKR